LFAIRKASQRKHFPVNGKHFPVKEKFGLVSRKVFFLLVVFVFRKVVSGKPLSKLFCVCLPLEKLVNGKHFPFKEKFDLVFRKVFSWKIWTENTFRETTFQTFLCLFAIRKVGQRKTLSSQRKI
jgi:uncharacterized protein YlzI (FlbEa/FlbD family)